MNSYAPPYGTEEQPLPAGLISETYRPSGLADASGNTAGLSDGVLAATANFAVSCLVLTGTVGGIWFIADKFKLPSKAQKAFKKSSTKDSVAKKSSVKKSSVKKSSTKK